VVDETVFRRVVLGLERSEQGLLGTQDLDSRGGVLGEVHQASGVADQSSTDKLTNERGEVGRDSLHSVSEVVGQLSSVLGDRDDLITKGVDVSHIGVGDLGTHGQLGSRLDSGLEVLRKDELERGGRSVGSETWEWLIFVARDPRRGLTHRLDNLGVGKIVDDDLAHLGEVPSVPFLKMSGCLGNGGKRELTLTLME
jgi:hypothetical protein